MILFNCFNQLSCMTSSSKLRFLLVSCQIQDVRREIAAFVPILWSKIRKGGQPFSVVQCETQANALHEATDQTDLDSLLHPQVFA